MPESQPTRRERERSRRRNEILDAAGRVFVGRGYSAATMDDVAAEAELSKGTLYLYFESKEALFLSLSNRELDGVLAAFAAIMASGAAADGLTQFRHMLVAYAENALRSSEKFRAMVGRLASNSVMDVDDPAFAGHRQRIDKVIGSLVSSLVGGQEDGSVRSELDALATAAEAWSGMVGVLLMSINFSELQRRFPRPLNGDRVVPEFIDIFIRGIRSSP